MSTISPRSFEIFAKLFCEIPDTLSVLEDPQSIKPPGSGMFRILSRQHGDTRVVWNRYSLAEVRAAKEMFDDLILKGLIPYVVGDDGRASAIVMDEFDPSAEEVLFMPIQMLAGG